MAEDDRDAALVPRAATASSGATVIGGVQVLPLRLPRVPAGLEAAALGVAHGLVAAPVLVAISSPAMQIMGRFWLSLLHRASRGVAAMVTDIQPWFWFRKIPWISWGTAKSLLATAALIGLVSILVLPLQAGARRRAPVHRRTLPLYALFGGFTVAGLMAWSGLLEYLLHWRTPLAPTVLLLGLWGASRVAAAGRRAGPERSELREIGRELALGAGAGVAALLGTVLLVAGGVVADAGSVVVGVAMMGGAGLALAGGLALRPLWQVARAGAPREVLAREPAAALPEGSDAARLEAPESPALPES